MKRHILLIIATAIIGMTLNACTINIDGEKLGGKTIKGNGNIVTRTYDVSDFNNISIALPAKVNYTVSTDYTCTVRVDENILEYLDIKVQDQELLMGKQKDEKNTTLRATEFVIDVTAPSLESINLAGRGKFNALSPIEGESLRANVAGSGDILFKEKVTVDTVEMNVAGSGDIECNELVADKLDANVAGSGDLNVKAGKVVAAEVGVAGSGDCVLACEIDSMEANVAGSGDIMAARVNDNLEYGIIGSGSISYGGNPVVKGDKVGSGSIKHVE